MTKEEYTCKECSRWADLHSSCSAVRDMMVKSDDKACVDFKLSYLLKKKNENNITE